MKETGLRGELDMCGTSLSVLLDWMFAKTQGNSRTSRDKKRNTNRRMSGQEKLSSDGNDGRLQQ